MHVMPNALHTRKQSHIGTTSIGGDHDATCADRLDYAAHSPTDHRECIEFHASFQDAGIVRTPVNRGGPTAYDERDRAQMVWVFHGPINGQAHCHVPRELMDGLSQHRIGSQPGIAPRMMDQP